MKTYQPPFRVQMVIDKLRRGEKYVQKIVDAQGYIVTEVPEPYDEDIQFIVDRMNGSKATKVGAAEFQFHGSDGSVVHITQDTDELLLEIDFVGRKVADGDLCTYKATFSRMQAAAIGAIIDAVVKGGQL